jgi:chromosome segregation ATPase
MMMDNASLQRRLNGVNDDMEQLKREKDDLISKLRMIEIDNERLGRITNQKDEIDMANQTMQEDLERARDDNKNFEEKMRREQAEATNVGGQLNVTSADKQNLVFESHNIEADLMKTLQKLDELRKVFDDILREMDRNSRAIEELNAEDLALNHANIDLASQVARVQADRQDLNKRVQELTIIFDDTVRDKTHDRRMIDDKRRWQTKILTCKILNQFILKHQRYQVH